MQPIVRDLYKRFLFVAKDYPAMSYQECKQQIKQEFFARKHIEDQEELLKAVHFGRYKVREAMGFIQFHKYRHLRKAYNSDEHGLIK